MKCSTQLDETMPGLRGALFGVPREAAEAAAVVVTAPWGVTASYGRGASDGARDVVMASSQLDFYHEDIADSRLLFPALVAGPEWIGELDRALTPDAEVLSGMLDGRMAPAPERMQALRDRINEGCRRVVDFLTAELEMWAGQGKAVALLGGDHSCALAAIRAATARHAAFGILQFDAHMDLRDAYMGLTYSHASVMRLALAEGGVSRLVQVGVRDVCAAEVAFAQTQEERVVTFSDRRLQHALFSGVSWNALCARIVAELPSDVYMTFDVDVLRPFLCPGTGTPVPGGLDFEQALYLAEQVMLSGRRIVGLDVCETGGGTPQSEWDANVGARVLWRLCATMMQSRALAAETTLNEQGMRR